MSSTSGRSYRPSSYSQRSSENLPPRTLARVGREIRDLHKNPPEGVRLVVDAETGLPASLGEVVAEIEGPTDTPYESKYFQLKLVLSVDFPASPPRGHFLTKIYHPNVDMSTGAICVNTLKKDWTPETTFSHVLSIIRCLMIVPFPESSLNDEAGKLFMESYDEYAKRARLMANVHGRPRPSSAMDDSENGKGSQVLPSVENRDGMDRSNKSLEGDSPSVVPLDRSNSLRTMNRSNSATSSATSSTKSINSKGEKKSKKKSLRRL